MKFKNLQVWRKLWEFVRAACKIVDSFYVEFWWMVIDFNQTWNKQLFMSEFYCVYLWSSTFTTNTFISTEFVQKNVMLRCSWPNVLCMVCYNSSCVVPERLYLMCLLCHMIHLFDFFLTSVLIGRRQWNCFSCDRIRTINHSHLWSVRWSNRRWSHVTSPPNGIGRFFFLLWIHCCRKAKKNRSVRNSSWN